MYIIIDEDGSVYKTDTIDKNLMDDADNGFVDIINISVEEPVIYYDSTWHEIEDYYIDEDKED